MTTGDAGEGAVAARSGLEAIVLAGGAGTRFGGRKLTNRVRGGLLIDGALRTAFAAPTRGVLVVTGADPGVGPASEAFAERIGESGRLRVVHAVDHGEGMAATLRAGVSALPEDMQGVFVFLGDMPRIPTAVLAPLARALEAGALAAAPVWAGVRGHPVVFAAALAPRLRVIRGDTGPRELLRSLGGALTLVAAPDDGILFDVDTADDLPPD